MKQNKNHKKIRISDLITTFRIVLAVILSIIFILFPYRFPLLFELIILIIILILDGIDGIIARKYDAITRTGSFYDIAGDRIVETILQVPFVYYRILDPIVLIYYLTKDFVVDYIRTANVINSLEANAPFDQLRYKVSKALVKSRFMRFIYGFMKTLMFVTLVMALHNAMNVETANLIAYLTVFISILRSVPPVYEYVLKYFDKNKSK